MLGLHCAHKFTIQICGRSKRENGWGQPCPPNTTIFFLIFQAWLVNIGNYQKNKINSISSFQISLLYNERDRRGLADKEKNPQIEGKLEAIQLRDWILFAQTGQGYLCSWKLAQSYCENGRQMHIFWGERDRTQKIEDRRQAYLERQRWTDRQYQGTKS